MYSTTSTDILESVFTSASTVIPAKLFEQLALKMHTLFSSVQLSSVQINSIQFNSIQLKLFQTYKQFTRVRICLM